MVNEAEGELVGGRYRLIEPVGEGGMGQVWRGWDELLDREVAVKEIRFPPGMNAAQREVFGRRAMREARSAARLNHPGIVTVHDVTTRDGVPVIVMEFVRGVSLRQRIDERGRLDPAEVARIGTVMVEALGEAHAAGIVHRDLKPANVLLTESRVVITDFGIAALAGDADLTESGMLLGTPAFMAPEQAKGLPATPAGDLWSLGATLYAAVEGRPPYVEANLMAVLAALLSREPEPPVHAGPLTPVLAGLLRRDPAQRLSGDQAAEALVALTGRSHPRPDTRPAGPRPDGGPVNFTAPFHGAGAMTTDTAVEPRALPRRRLPLLAGLVALVALVAIGVPVAIALTGTPSDPVLPGPAAAQSAKAAETEGTGKLVEAEEAGGTGKLAEAEEAEEAGEIGEAGQWVVTTTLVGHTLNVSSVAAGPDGRTLASGSYDNTVRLWDVAGGESVATLTGHTRDVLSVAVSPDGTTLASGGDDDTVRLWDVAGRESVAILTGHQGSVSSVAFSPDGKTLASGSYDGTVRLWDVAGRRLVTTLAGHGRGILSVAFSPDGKTLATGSRDRTVRIWDVAEQRSGTPLTGHTGVVWSVVFSPDGKTLFTGGGDQTVRVWDVAGGENTAALVGHTRDVRSVAVSPDGGTLVSGGEDDTARVWDVRGRKSIATLTGHTDTVRAVTFSPDGKTLVTGSRDDSIRLWQVR